GSARQCAARRSLYHVHTSCGSRAKPSGEASSSTRCERHRPLTPRNVGKPLSAEMPAPVSTKTDLASFKRSMRSRASKMAATTLPYHVMPGAQSNDRNVTDDVER